MLFFEHWRVASLWARGNFSISSDTKHHQETSMLVNVSYCSVFLSRLAGNCLDYQWFLKQKNTRNEHLTTFGNPETNSQFAPWKWMLQTSDAYFFFLFGGMYVKGIFFHFANLHSVFRCFLFLNPEELQQTWMALLHPRGLGRVVGWFVYADHYRSLGGIDECLLSSRQGADEGGIGVDVQLGECSKKKTQKEQKCEERLLNFG